MAALIRAMAIQDKFNGAPSSHKQAAVLAPWAAWDLPIFRSPRGSSLGEGRILARDSSPPAEDRLMSNK